MLETDVLVEAVEDYVRRSVQPIAARLLALEQELHALVLAKGDPGRDGKDGLNGLSVTLDDVRPMLGEMVAAIPRPKDGKDGARGSRIIIGDGPPPAEGDSSDLYIDRKTGDLYQYS